MKINCASCGIAKRENNKLHCLKYHHLMSPDTPGTERECTFFTHLMEEDGEVLSPEEHLMLKEVEMQARGFKGPI
ncbi:hypothetical protein SAMN05660649_02771 [Desulfotomaculum arcticum]|uniref:Uncharacterized protein n=1 Tax=Desulfotruncus arcticus DSM 17038 TaxID=1121424 RepID=A0A1I2UWB3_9FIRM|nr:hypothetical protein [Desulfotruncus arcticus]SFG81320.1 hypothetical protein SAMN05660649_02771 [Desulfotomaculum arcticum] [Desulfotruncus arcticus DSM 17038]